jgi:enhancing lycopene biosynthesis protein 2
MKKVGVLLCGSGYRDGSEIRESVAALWALSHHSVNVQCYAPDKNQYDVVNCKTGEPVKNESRNMLVEAARIARGAVLPLEELDVSELSALVIPGGFGVAKNLCTFAFAGSKGTVLPRVASTIQEMHRGRKPIAAICIAPALVGLALQGTKVELTLGAAGEAAQELEKLGHTHVVCRADQFHFDSKNKIVSTPAYMHDSAPLVDIFAGIKGAVDQLFA